MFDTLWIMFCSLLVFLMQAGFLSLETGFTRSKNSINVAVKNLVDFGISVFLFSLISYNFIFFGKLEPFNSSNISEVVFFIFQVMFCGTATTIVSGAVAERLKFDGYIIIAAVSSILIYPLFANFAWEGLFSGQLTGILGKNGFVDFAGSSVVHSIGGWLALSAVLVIGPRVDFIESRQTKRIQGNNLPFAVLGVFLLWFGWFGFNAGSLLKFKPDLIALVFANTLFGGTGGLITALLFTRIFKKVIKVEVLIIGALAGLVSVTAGCHAFTPLLSLAIGGMGAIAAIFADDYLQKSKIDDVVSAIPVHTVAGVWGTLAVGLFANLDALGTGLNRLEQIEIQLKGIGICFILAFGLSFIIFKTLNHFWSLRVSREDEINGLNFSEHGASSEYSDLINKMVSHSIGDNFKPIHIDSEHTEVGALTEHYNRVIKQVNKLLQQNIESMAIIENERQTSVDALNAKSIFLANMSHEVRTPLNGILGFSDFLLSDLKEGDKGYEEMTLIQNSAQALLTVVNDILDYSKAEAGKLVLEETPLNLNEIINETITIFELQAKNQNTKVTADISGQIHKELLGDSFRLKQVLNNLLGNAIKFTKNGKIHLNLRLISDETSSQIVEFKVVDTGIGIKKEALDRLLSPFEQEDNSTTRKFGGTGLGLSICEQILNKMDSNLKIESRFGSGSTFSFILHLQKNNEKKFLKKVDSL